MNNLINSLNRPQALSVRGYEERILMYKEQVIGGYIGIGRTLIEAKETGAVPHGEWEEWATATTGMSIRNVQRCMQAAREISDGSPLARLDMSKALLLLSSGLDEEKREAIGAVAAEEQISVKELQRRIAEARATAREECQAEARRIQAAQDLKHKQELTAAQHDVAAKFQARVNELQEQFNAAAGMIQAKEDELQREREAAAQALEAAKANATPSAEVARLRARLEKADADRQAAQQQLLAIKSQQATATAGNREQTGLTVERFGSAVRAFLVEVGELPYMGVILATADYTERQQYQMYLERVTSWLELSRHALQTCVVQEV